MQTTIEEVHFVLSVPIEKRMSLFLVKKSFFREMFDKIDKPLKEHEKHIIESGEAKKAKQDFEQAAANLKKALKGR